MEKLKNLFVDIDGTITNETEGHDYSKRTPRLDVIRLINSYYYSGCIITYYTSRYSCDEKITKEWFIKYGVCYNTIIFDKPSWDFLIDDKAGSAEEFLEKVSD